MPEKFVPCPEPMRGCPYTPPFEDEHHTLWPARDYTTPLEKAFRELPENKVRTCRCLHLLMHLARPPRKPEQRFMRQRVDLHYNSLEE